MSGKTDRANKVARAAPDSIPDEIIGCFERNDLLGAVSLVRALPDPVPFPLDFLGEERAALFRSWLADVRIYSIFRDGVQSGDIQAIKAIGHAFCAVVDKNEGRSVDLSHLPEDKTESTLASVFVLCAFHALRKELLIISDLQLRVRIGEAVARLVECSAQIGRVEGVSPNAKAARARKTHKARGQSARPANDRRNEVRDTVFKHLSDLPTSTNGRIADLLLEEVPHLYKRRNGKGLMTRRAVENDVAELREQWMSRKS